MKRILWESKYAKATEPPIPVVGFVFFGVFKMKLMKPPITVLPHTSNYELVIIKLISGK